MPHTTKHFFTALFVLLSLWRADHSSRGVLPTVVRRCVWSRNLVNEKALAHCGGYRAKNKQKLFFLRSLFCMYNVFCNRRQLTQIAAAVNVSLWNQKYMYVPHCWEWTPCPSSNSNRLIFHMEITAIWRMMRNLHILSGETLQNFSWLGKRYIYWSLYTKRLCQSVLKPVQETKLRADVYKEDQARWLARSVAQSLHIHCNTAILNSLWLIPNTMKSHCTSDIRVWKGQ
jgi:hypothetical protein